MTTYLSTWPNGRYRTARKEHRCDFGSAREPCLNVIQRLDRYFDPMEACPDRAGGFGGFRFCLKHEEEAP